MREGREEYVVVKKILGIRLNKKHVISEFLVENASGSEWISKKDAIVLAQSGVLYATVIRAKSGVYLRPRSHQKSFGNMVY